MKLEDPEKTCRLKQGEKTCAFLTMGSEGFECVRGSLLEKTLRFRIVEGSIVAKGVGDWEECVYKE